LLLFLLRLRPPDIVEEELLLYNEELLVLGTYVFVVEPPLLLRLPPFVAFIVADNFCIASIIDDVEALAGAALVAAAASGATGLVVVPACTAGALGTAAVVIIYIYIYDISF